MMKFHRWDTNRSYRILHSPFMRLIHEVPYINCTIRFSNETHTRSARTPASWSMEASFTDHTREKRYLNYWLFYIDVVLPDAEMEVVNSKNDIFVRRKKVEGNNRSEATLLTPIRNNRIVFAACFVSRSGSPVTNKKLSLVRSACKDCSFLIFVESQKWSSHSASSLRSEKMETVACFPVD